MLPTLGHEGRTMPPPRPVNLGYGPEHKRLNQNYIADISILNTNPCHLHGVFASSPWPPLGDLPLDPRAPIISSRSCARHVLLYKIAQLSLTNPRDAKACQNYFNSTCLQRCRWQYWPIFMRLTAIASEIREIPRNSLKIQTYGLQGHPRSPILVPIESPCVTCY